MKKILLVGFNKKEKDYLLNKFYKKNFVTSMKNEKKISAIICSKRKYFQKILEKKFFNKINHLDCVHLHGAGIEEYLFLDKYKIDHFTNIKSIQGNHVADHAMALLLALTRKISFIVKQGQNKKFDFRPIELFNKRALIVGFGSVGRNIAKRAHSFGIKITIVSDKYKDNKSFILKTYKYSHLEKAVTNADIIFIAAPLTNKTQFLFDEKIFKKCKKNSILINVSRGKIILTDILIKYLNNKKILAAGLDVTFPEPLPKYNKLLNMDNVIITPHIAGISENFSNRHFALIEKNIKRYLNNLSLVNKVNLKRGY